MISERTGNILSLIKYYINKFVLFLGYSFIIYHFMLGQPYQCGNKDLGLEHNLQWLIDERDNNKEYYEMYEGLYQTCESQLEIKKEEYFIEYIKPICEG